MNALRRGITNKDLEVSKNLHKAQGKILRALEALESPEDRARVLRAVAILNGFELADAQFEPLEG